MHRIISVRRAAVNNFRRLTIQRCSCAEHRLVWTATLSHQELLTNKFKIQQIGQVECIRTQSTTPSTDVASRKRKRRKFRGSRFVELLQVTNNATKQTKTKVENLKAGNLSKFVLTSNLPPSKKAKKKEIAKDEINYQPVEYQRVNLEMLDNTAVIQSEFYDERPLVFFGKEVKGIKAIEVNEILKSFNNFKEIIETIKDEYSEEMDYRGNKILDEDRIEEKEDDLEAVIETVDAVPINSKSRQQKKTLAKNQKQERYKSKFHVSQEQEKLAKHNSLQVNLNSYLNVCVSVGAISRGLSLLLVYRQKYKKAGLDVRWFGIEPYNILLKGCAETGNYEKIREICGVLKEDGIAKNHQTFAAIFECLGRSDPTESNIKLIQKYKEKAENMGISMNNILDKSEFQFDQREIVLDAIQRVQPNFEPNYTPPKLTYSNRLLEQLNEYVENSTTPNFGQEGRKIMNSKKGFTKKQLQEYARQQLRIELEGTLTVNSVEDNSDSGPNAEHSKQKWEQLQKEWRNTICAAINRDMTVLRAQSKYKPQSYMTYFTYLKTVKPELYADILLNEIRMLAEGSETYSPTVNQLYRALGQRVYAKFQIEKKKSNGVLDKVGEIYAQYCEKWEECNTSDNPRQMWQRIVHDNQHWGPTMNLEEKPWPNSALLGIGRFLYNILMRDIKIDLNITKVQNKNKQRNNLLPAFYTLFRNQGKSVKEEVKPHPILSKLLRSSRQKTLTFDANMVPMLCPPQPWSSSVNGGYLLTNSDLIRLPQQAVQQWSRIKNSNPQDLYPALDSLNQLASIPWRVNKDILDVVLEVFKKGGNDKLDVPQPPSSLPPLRSASEKNSNMTSNERFQMFRQKMIHKRRQAEMYSLWCDTLYRLSLANHYRDRVFWLPHNMDFRGRVYPVPPHLNHLGSDLARSMLVFDQAQPLGIDGFSWLKLHCINLTGLKKRDSIRERLLYAEEIMDDIIDSGERPLTGRKWWAKSDEPWQTLACCIEIAKVRKCPEPEKYMCRLPIHQDGSCNGLQHYAALGRDKSGAISVNLAPSATPQDVYSAVAALVEKTRQTDAESGLHVAQILNGYVRRKVIKQTVMTTVYGVTRYGARLQIAKQLKDIEEFPKEWVWPASTYLTTKTFESLREMFTSTKEIQDWFTECARMISAVCGQNVEWVTPLGLPVVQPYSRFDSKKVSPMNGTKIKERLHMDMYEKPNVMKQKNAFPPNFIHSLDSSHMMLTSLYCERKGITFVSVHDCFWTHACTVPVMNKICREQFVALHSESILEDLSKFLTQKYSFSEKDLTNNGSAGDATKQKLNKLLGKLPDKGNFDLENVLDSVYFFS